MAILEAKDITKSFGDLRVLKGVNLTVQEGEIISVVGASGSGKTTLLQILGTLDSRDSGSILLNGSSIDRFSSKKLAQFRNKHLGFVFQFHHLLPEFTALENVCMPLYINGLKRSDAEKRGREILAFLGLANRAEHKPSEMSGGEQQRVAVARALINRPDIVFADEPSGNLDAKSSEELHQLFFDLRKEFNQTFVIVTHNTELADSADRKLSMKSGVLQ
jgi:lipoprotein-releasing system ATP-binding protein